MNKELSAQEFEEMMEMSSRIDEISRKVDQMYCAIVGNEKLGQEGLVHRLQKLEDKVSEMEQIITKTKGYIAGAAGVGTVIGFLISSILKFILK